MNFQWNININQRAAVELGLHVDLIDLAIFDFIKSFILSNRCTRIVTPEGTFYWVSHKNIQDYMPLLNIKSSRGIFNRVNNLVENGLLIKYSKCENLGKTLYAIGPNYDRFEFFDTPEQKFSPPERKLIPLNKNSAPPRTKVQGTILLDTNTPLNNNPTLFNNKDSLIISPQGEKIEQDLSFVAEEFFPIFKEWLAYKREKKQTYKSKASLKQCYCKLIKLSNNNPATAQEIIEDAIANNYAGFFPIKETSFRIDTHGKAFKERRDEFYDRIAEFIPQYNKKLLHDFYLYWSQEVEGGFMLWETCQAFDIDRRLKIYNNRNGWKYVNQ